ncbi:hypothetical protein PGB90_006984 [Kerria lacca]
MKFIHPFFFLLGILLSGVTYATQPEEKHNAESAPTEKSEEVILDISKTESSVKVEHTSNIHISPNVTTTKKPITTTAASTPKPDEDKPGDWSVSEGNVTCIKVRGFINVIMEGKNKSTSETIKVPPTASVNGSCTDEFIRFIIDRVTNSTLQLKFSENNNEFMLSRVDGLVKTKGGLVGFGGNVSAFITPLGRSYVCNQTIDVTVNKTVIELKNFRIEAFRNTTSKDFGSEYECPSDKHVTPDIVPVVVGCALAILVIAVLVAYLISRRRSQARGYLSM